MTYYEQALKLDRELGYQLGIARELMNIGTLHVQQQHFVEAESLLIEAIALLQQLGHPKVEQAQTWLVLARTGRGKSDRSSSRYRGK